MLLEELLKEYSPLTAIRMTSSSRDIYFHTPSRNQTKLWPVEKNWLESFIMFVPSPFLINPFSSFLFVTCQVFCYWPHVFLAIHQQETALNETKTKVSHWRGLNYRLLSFKIYWHLSLDFMPEHRLFRIADKECHGNYVLISKEQHWRSPSKKLHNKITGLPGKNPRYKEKLKLIWKNQVYGLKEL